MQNLRDYFGEKTALYFAFLGEYMRWQFVLAIVGSITGAYNMYRQSNEESPLAPWFALFVGAWAETHARHWRTYEFAFALRYGINERDEAFLNMRDRPYFHGKITRSVIDGSEITHYPWERRAARYGMSILCISIAALSGCILVTLILYLRVFMMKRRGATHEWAETVSSGVLGVYITVIECQRTCTLILQCFSRLTLLTFLFSCSIHDLIGFKHSVSKDGACIN